MSFLFPRTVTITLPEGAELDRPGAQGYAGLERAKEPVVLRDLPASIQHGGTSRGSGAELPASAPSKMIYKILIPAHAAPKGSIVLNATVVDDLGDRYQVTAPVWGPLGHNLRCERQDA